MNVPSVDHDNGFDLWLLEFAGTCGEEVTEAGRMVLRQAYIAGGRARDGIWLSYKPWETEVPEKTEAAEGDQNA